MKYLIFLFPIFIFGQVQDINLNNPKTKTVPFWDNDRTEIINKSANNNAILRQLDEQIDLLNGSAIRSVKKNVPNNSTVNFFTLTSSGKSFSLIIQVVSDTANFYVVKQIDLTYTDGNVGMFSKVSHLTNSNDFDLIATPITGGVRISIQNLSTSVSTEINMVMTIAPSTNPATFTIL